MSDFTAKLNGITGAMAQLKAGGAKLNRAIDLSVRQQAELMRKDIIQGIRKQAPGGQSLLGISKLNRAIRKMRGFGGTKALIHTATMVNSIKVEKAAPAAYFVGILRGGRGERGQMLSDIASAQEFGKTYVVRITPALRNFLLKAMRLAKMLRNQSPRHAGYQGRVAKKTMVVKIPPRPFIAPVVNAARREPVKIQKELAARVARNLGWTLGGR